jgi:hypothetical protein
VSANVLPGQHHTLRCEATGKHPMTYVWYKDGQQLLNTNSPTLDIPAFAGEHVGCYCCQISNAYGGNISQNAELALGEFSCGVRQTIDVCSKRRFIRRNNLDCSSIEYQKFPYEKYTCKNPHVELEQSHVIHI